jgi:hypothetical protein
MSVVLEEIDCDVEGEEKFNPMTDLVEDCGVDSASKWVEGCRATLSAMSFARRDARHSETVKSDSWP